LHDKVVVVSVTEAMNPYETIIRHLCVTSALNFLSADFGYCLFPKRTMVRKECQVCKPNALNREEKQVLENFSEFGFRVIPWGERRQDEEMSSKRMIGDDLTWTVQLYGAMPPGVSVKDSIWFRFTECTELLLV
jgi:hypothetical protein